MPTSARPSRRWVGTRRLHLALLASLLVTGSPAMALADVPTPSVAAAPDATPGSPDRNYPFFGTDIVLAHYGYVEEEFFYSGIANTYATAQAGTPASIRNAEVSATGLPYRSRLLVRRPTQQSRFNGIVIVEWLNVTNQYDTDVLWLYQKEFFIREGYAWVGVSAQNAGLSNPETGLKAWSPGRYGTLDVTAGGTIAGDALSYDIYSQAAAAIRNVTLVLGGLQFSQIVAAGQSQSAGRLGTYLNQVHQRDPTYDAALLTVNNPQIRPDITIPVIKVLSETERNGSRSQPDLEKVRVWTVAGSTHSEQYSLLSRAAFLLRDLNRQAVDTCETPARSRVEIRYVYNAAVDALVQWTKSGRPAPHAPHLVFDEEAVKRQEAARAAQAPARGEAPPAPEGRGGVAGGRGGRRGGGPAPSVELIKRDEHGNALGGIRLAEIEAPVAKESAELCGLGGTHLPFDSATLYGLYPTHDAYVAKVTAASRAAVRAGFLLPADAEQTIDKAKRSIWGMQLACGPLCADVRQFPSHPSSILLANQTAYLLIKGGDDLVQIMDEVTRALAEGYTLGASAAARVKFAEAAARLQAYMDMARTIEAAGGMRPETAALLTNQAGTLQRLVGDLAK